MSSATTSRINLSTLAAILSRVDGDGHRWVEDEARQWLLRMGFVADAASDADRAGGGPAAWADDPRLLRLLDLAG